jgi:hypothetical protein
LFVHQQPVVLVAYRLLAPGSEWRLHRDGFSAARWPICWARMPDWTRSTSCTAVTVEAFDSEVPPLADAALESLQTNDHLVERWRDLFNITYDAASAIFRGTERSNQASSASEADASHRT